MRSSVPILGGSVGVAYVFCVVSACVRGIYTVHGSTTGAYVIQY